MLTVQLKQKKPPTGSPKVALNLCGGLIPLECRLKLLSNKGGTWKVCLPCSNINFFQHADWHTDIECCGSGCGLLSLGDFGLLCAAGLSRLFACSHSFFPFISVVNKWTQMNSMTTNIFQHFFVVALRPRKVVTFSQVKGEQ